MKGFAIHNAPTDHGGRIPATQMMSSQMGNLFVVAGDGHLCPRCKCWSTVLKSHDHVIFDGKAVAYVGDKLTCGARILPQQSHVVGDSGGGGGNANQVAINLVYSDQYQLVEKDSGEPLVNQKYKIHREDGRVLEGITDQSGYTQKIVNSEKSENIKIEVISDDFNLEEFLNEYF